MNKFFLFFFALLIFFSLLSQQALAKQCTGPNAQGLVPCGQDPSCPCEISDFFEMIARIYNFIVYTIISPLAVVMITIGAIFLMASAGNPKLAGTGKTMIFSAIIGLVLALTAWVIVNFVMKEILGISGWNIFN